MDGWFDAIHVRHDYLLLISTAVQSRNLLKALATIAVTTTDKTTCHLCIYCLAVQNFDSRHLDPVINLIIEALEYVLGPSLPHSSARIVNEALEVVHKLYKTHPRAMASESLASRWILALYHHLFGAIETRKHTCTLLNDLLRDELMRFSIPTSVSIKVKEFVMGGHALTLQSLASGVGGESPNERLDSARHAVGTWAVIILLLGPDMLGESTLVNPLLQTPKRTFTDGNQVVRAETFNMWRTLIEVLSRDAVDVLPQTKIKLILAPYLNCLKKERIIVVRQACLTSWISSVNKMCERVSLIGLFKSMVAPILELLLYDNNPGIRADGFGVLNGFLATATEAGARFQVPPLPFRRAPDGASIETEYIELMTSNTSSWCSAVSKAIIDAANIGDAPLKAAVLRAWRSMLRRVLGPTPFISKSGPIESGISDAVRCVAQVVSPAAGVLKPVEDIKVRGRWVTNTIAIAEELLSQGMRHLASAIIDEETPAFLYLAQAWVHAARPAMTTGEDKLRGVFARLVDGVMRGPEPLVGLKQLVTTLESSDGAMVTENVPAALRCWTVICRSLQEHVDTTRQMEVGRTAPSQAGDYQTIYAVLLFPVRRLLHESSHGNLWIWDAPTLSNWGSLFASFHQTVALKTGRALADCVEGVCARLMAASDTGLSSQPSPFGMLVECVIAIVEQLDMSESTIVPKHLCALLARLATAGLEAYRDGKWKDLGDHQMASTLRQRCIHVLRTISTLFGVLSTRPAVDVAIDVFSDILAQWLAFDKMPVGVLEVVISELFGSVRRVTGLHNVHFSSSDATPKINAMFNNKLLQKLTTILVATLGHSSNSIRFLSVQFWQDSFGLRDSKKGKLVYSHELHKVMARLRSEAVVTLPDWIDNVDEALGIPTIVETRASTPPPMRPRQSPLRQSGLQSPLRPSSGLRSPNKSPGTTLTPSRRTPTTRRKRLDFDDDEVFVSITPSPKKTRVMTQHQKESRHRADGLPVMYTDLDASLAPVDASQTGTVTFTGAATAAAEEATRIAGKKRVHFDIPMLQDLDQDAFNALSDNTEPADKILRSLVPGGYKSFSQVMMARNPDVKTIGDLAKLTKEAARQMPLPSDPVKTLSKALLDYHHRQVPPIVPEKAPPSWFHTDSKTLARTMSVDELHDAQKQAMELMARLVETAQIQSKL